MRKTTKEAAVRSEEDRRADSSPRDAAHDESERIDQIVERHRETLDRLARD